MSISFSKNKLWTFYQWCLLFVMLDSLKAWLFWHLPNQFVVPIFFLIISIVIYNTIPDFFLFEKKKSTYILVALVLAMLVSTRGNFNSFFGGFLLLSNTLIFIGLKDQYKMEFLKFFTKKFSIFITISVAWWILYLIGVPLPHFEDSFGFSERRNEAQYFYDNYVFFLRNLGTKYSDFSDLILPRFSCIFLEPGYFSLILVVLLFLNRFRFKEKSNQVLLVALILSFSLAGWIIGIFAYISFSIRNSKNRFLLIFLISAFLITFYLFFSSYNNGNNVINKYIFERLEYDEEKGTITGYNRTAEEFEKWFSTEFLKSDNVLFGINLKNIFGETTNVGWKVYMVNYGLIGLFFYILFLLIVYLYNKNYNGFLFFILYILFFMRGHHIIFWAAYPILYIAGAIKLKNDEKIESQKKEICKKLYLEN
jgi:hypothetical protein